ncbi:MAG: arsenic resistance N-acetyltransferase ArsN2 [Thermacetogeniaceae bacterium]
MLLRIKLMRLVSCCVASSRAGMFVVSVRCIKEAAVDNLKIVLADTGDVLPVQGLLSEAGLPQEDVTEHLQHFLLAKRDGILVGVVGLEALGEFGLLRSLAVAGEHRGKGIGNLLHENMIAYARLQGIKQLYALTLTIEDFLSKRGFRRIAREEVPEPLKATEEFRSICPASAICMTRNIGEGIGAGDARSLRLMGYGLTPSNPAVP